MPPWLVASQEVPFVMITSFFAASCNYSIALAKAALWVGELVAGDFE